MDDVARWPAADRAALFQEAAARPGLPGAVAVEKDFWVCWALRRAFDPAAGPLVPGMVFKGGTSLSKVYRAIARFSEDLDLSIPREALGFGGEHDLAPGMSRTQAGRRLDDLRAACEAHVAGPLAAALRDRVAAALAGAEGAPAAAPGVGAAAGDAWDLAVAPDDPGTLLFRYPAALAAAAYGAAAYIRPTVRLEFGGRNEVWPAEPGRVRPYALEAFPAVSAEPWAEVQVLAAERTFWEKATICHAENQRPEASRRPERLSRHYADLAALARGRRRPTGARAARPARGGGGAQGALLPGGVGALRRGAAGRAPPRAAPGARARALRRDYAAMREMFFEAAPAFDAVLGTLRALEDDVVRPVQHAPTLTNSAAQ